MNIALLTLSLTVTAVPADGESTHVVIIVGAEGTKEYGKQFHTWADRWESAAKRGGAKVTVIGSASLVGRDPKSAEGSAAVAEKRSEHSIVLASATVRSTGPSASLLTPSPQDVDRERLRETVSEGRAAETWVVLIGHGTFDGKTSRFNLRGRDVSAGELHDWLPAGQRTVVVNCASCSGAFVQELRGANRVVVTATKSGHEYNFARFGDFLSQSIADTKADLDKDGQTSLLEAWLRASRRTEEFYKTAGRLATEHATLDDNGDGAGVRANAFRGLRPIGNSADAPADGYRAHQWHLVKNVDEANRSAAWRAKAAQLELAVIQLREHKAEWDETEYYRQLEAVLTELAELYEGSKSVADPSVAQTLR